MSRPSDAGNAFEEDVAAQNPGLGPLGWIRWAWRQLTSMRTALLLLLALAVAAVPGSIIPQESADPNGVVQWQQDDPAAAKVIEALQGFDVYSSFWFSAIYILLFISLIGCVIPRVRHHLSAVQAAPPRTPSRFDRLPARSTVHLEAAIAPALDAAERLLKRRGYRTVRYGTSVSAERGYLRETGNLVFHSALLGVLLAVFVGGGFTYTGQKTVVEGGVFANTVSAYDSPPQGGRFFTARSLQPYSLRLDHLAVSYQRRSAADFGAPLDYTATVTTDVPGEAPQQRTIKVNHPLDIGGTSVFLLGNGYAPHVVVRNAAGAVVSDEAVPFQPETGRIGLDSTGVIKVHEPSGPDVGFQGLLFPTVDSHTTPTQSIYPALGDPLLDLNVFEGKLGTTAENDFVLNTSPGHMKKVAGFGTKTPGLILTTQHPTATLPDGLGSVTLEGIPRYAAFTIHHDPSEGWVAVFVALAVAGLITSLLVPRRRMWIRLSEEEGGLRAEYAGLARGDDPGLTRAIADLERAHREALPPAPAREPVGV